MIIIIKQLPATWSYFMHFLLGFYELQDKKEIQFKFKSNLFINIASKCNNDFFVKCLSYMDRKICKSSNCYNLKGEVILDNGLKRKFVIDCADSPYLFSSKDLEECDIYFKMQCPKELNSNGFALTPEVVIPWTDYEKEENSNARKVCSNFEKNKYKIKPLMVGTRKLSSGISYSLLKKGYDNYMKSNEIEKNKKLMCYFGDSKGPIPIAVSKENLDVNKEAQLMGYYEKQLQHPNEKRAKAADIISKMEPKEKYDARIINNGNSDSGSLNKADDLVVPLEKFCDHIAGFEYNLNISGYRLSIPNRFIESFIAGTAIFTDQLAVKWYKPFEEEVVETVPMGYLRDENVDWNQFEEDIKNLPKVDKKEILEAFDKKWSPVAVCNYMIEELSNI